MKKTAIITSLLMSIVGIGFAQESSETDNREKVQFELKGGINYSNIYDESGDQFRADAKFGPAAGAGVKIPFGKYFGLQPEVLISQKGFRASGMMLGSNYNFTRTTTYLDIPLQFAFKPSEFFTLVAGPQYSFLLHKRDVFSNSSSSYAQEQEFQNDNVRKNIFGVVGGIDINLKHITLGARLGWDIQNNNGDGTSSTPRYKNVWFQGTVGYAFYK
ncbi:MAG: porin family protein [Bacteroidia bacterium]